MGKKIWLSRQPRNFGSEKIVRTIVLSPIHVSRGKIFTFQAPVRFGGKSHGNPDF